MKKIKSMWDNNRVLFVLATIVIVCFVLMSIVVVRYFVGNGTSNYGDRLESIEKNPLEESDKEAIINKLKEKENVSEVSLHTQGKIIYVRIAFKNVTVDKAKEIASSSLEVINDKYLNNYDIHYTLTSAATDTATGFIVMGAKNIGESQKQIIWGLVSTKEIQSKEENHEEE